MKFSPVLAKYYESWYRNACESIVYCIEHNMPMKAEEYRKKSVEYFNFINQYWDQIEFYRYGDIAFYYPSVQFAEYNKLHQNQFATLEQFTQEFCSE